MLMFDSYIVHFMATTYLCSFEFVQSAEFAVVLLLHAPAHALTHICRMDFPIIIIRVSPLSVLGASGVILKFYSIFR